MSNNGSGTKWRWFIVGHLNRLQNQCWSDLVMWALNWYPKETRPWAPLRPITKTCRDDAARNGGCYCNKVNASEGRP